MALPGSDILTRTHCPEARGTPCRNPTLSGAPTARPFDSVAQSGPGQTWVPRQNRWANSWPPYPMDWHPPPTAPADDHTENATMSSGDTSSSFSSAVADKAPGRQEHDGLVLVEDPRPRTRPSYTSSSSCLAASRGTKPACSLQASPSFASKPFRSYVHRGRRHFVP